MKIYKISEGVYVWTKDELSPEFATKIDPQDAVEMERARVYFRRWGVRVGMQRGKSHV